MKAQKQHYQKSRQCAASPHSSSADETRPRDHCSLACVIKTTSPTLPAADIMKAFTAFESGAPVHVVFISAFAKSLPLLVLRGGRRAEATHTCLSCDLWCQNGFFCSPLAILKSHFLTNSECQTLTVCEEEIFPCDSFSGPLQLYNLSDLDGAVKER